MINGIEHAPLRSLTADVSELRRAAAGAARRFAQLGVIGAVGLVVGVMATTALKIAPASGVVFWAVAGGVVGLVAGYRLPVRLGRDGARLKRWVTASLTEDRGHRGRHGTWGFTVGMILALLLPSVLDALVAVGLVIALLTPLRRMIPATMTRRADAASRAAANVVSLGVLGAFTVSAGLPLVIGRLALLMAAAVWLLFGTRRARPPAGAVPIACLSFALALGLALAPRAQAAARRVKVRANKPMGSATVALKAGEQVTIDASGQVRFLPDKTAVAEADGGPSYYGGCDFGAPCGALIGRIGKANAPFFIGRHLVLPVQPAAGILELGVNDFDLTDNSGSFSATVVGGPPAATGVGVQSPTPLAGTTTSPPSSASRTSVPRPTAGLLCALGAIVGWLLGRGLSPIADSESGVYVVGRDTRHAFTTDGVATVRIADLKLEVVADAHGPPAIHKASDEPMPTGRRPRRAKATSPDPVMERAATQVFAAGDADSVVIDIGATTWGAYVVRGQRVDRVTSALASPGGLLVARAVEVGSAGD